MTLNEAGEVLQVIFAIFLYSSPFILIFASIWRVRRCRRAIERGDGLEAIAKAVGGEVATDPTFHSPFVRFTAEGARSYCYQWLLGTATPYVITTLECRASFPAFLEVLSRNSKRFLTRIPRFHERAGILDFRLVTRDEEWTRSVLNDGLGEILSDLRAWIRKAARIQLGPARLVVEIEDRLNPGEVAILGRLLIRLSSLARGSQTGAGVQFLGDAVFTSEGRCAVCGQLLSGARVQCAACRVPHHTDCWSYAGRCAIFGCSSRRIA
jgi:hypothetical protein